MEPPGQHAPMECEKLWHNARLATLTGPGLGLVERGVVAAQDGRIVYAGAQADAPALNAATQIDCAAGANVLMHTVLALAGVAS